MKSLNKYIIESGMVSVDGSHYEMDKVIKWDKPEYSTIEDMPIDDWRSQGVKYVLAWPPHKVPGGVVDHFIVSMFIRSKNIADIRRNGEREALINLKTLEVENADKIPQQAKDWELIRLK